MNGKRLNPLTLRSWVVWIVSFALWTLIALASTASRFQYAKAMGIPFTLYHAGILLVNCWIYALLTPIVFTLAGRHPLVRNRAFLQGGAYLLGGIAFTAAHSIIKGLVYPVREMPGISLRLFEHLFIYFATDDFFQIYIPTVVFAQMVSFYQRMKDKEVQLAQAQLRELKNKLHPHFLFNTMHSISALMFVDVKAADKMMCRLSDLLRLAIANEDTQETTLMKELEFLDVYLQIEKIRFKDRLEVQVDAHPTTLDAQVPHLILQPLVENAIRHGTSKLSEKGLILIRTYRDQARLYLVVRDTGPGFPKDAGAGHYRHGLGLVTTRERLKTLYGDSQHLVVQNLTQGGAEVCIEIPFRQQKITSVTL